MNMTTQISEGFELLKRFERLSEQLPGTLYQCRLAPDGAFSFPLVSASMQRMFGLDAEAVMQNPQLVLSRIYPDDSHCLWHSVQRSAMSLTEWQHEFRYCHPLEGVRWVSGHATPQREADGSILWHGFCEDITRHKNSQLALLESERRYRFIVENASDLIVLIDSEGVCRFVSPSATSVLGYDAQALDGQELIRWLPPDDAPRIQRLIHEAAARGQSIQLELRVRHANGHYLWLEANCSPYISPMTGRYQWLQVVGRDITDRKRRDMRLHELSTTDSMTGALNRAAFMGCLESALESADHTHTRLSLVVFDVDHFKETNDAWGHAAGDLVLACLGEVCRTTLRSNDIFGRIGGEEFALALSGQSLQEAMMLAERMRAKFEELQVEFHGHWLGLTVSFGVAERIRGESMAELLHRTDMGLYTAKRLGRNRVQQA
ncbi:sensor domain-containing diguanylate cyclase [Litchfieldella xinjiangensis]|uniref:sensor domain-containing diguanylate cyclase n=1 Tax=Litchfieldella xinjiangensis TaxID=1166948 RepID=UPI0005B80850|nr:sensor domain-containing diguanylate cyclase [Halomonas xinjiangensis]